MAYNQRRSPVRGIAAPLLESQGIGPEAVQVAHSPWDADLPGQMRRDGVDYSKLNINP